MKFTKAHLGVVFVFIAGIALGSVGSNFCRGLIFGASKGPAPTKELLLERMNSELDLSDEQLEKLKPIVFDLHEKFSALRQESNPKIREIVSQAVEKIRPYLDDSQKAQLNEMSERFLKRRQADS